MATASKNPEFNYDCEICGQEGLNDDEMRAHMVENHLQGRVNCPFCDLPETSPEEMLIHVNSAHLDYLTPSTPETDLMAFIDEDSAMEDHKNDECRGTTSQTSLQVTNLNGWSTKSSFYSSPASKSSEASKTGSFSKLQNNNNNNINNNNNNVGSNVNNIVEGAAGQGSPLRSSLNLQLRSHASVKSPVQECPMCPYSSDSPSRLEEHINRQHLDPTSPSLSLDSPPSRDGIFNCPICVTSYPNAKDLELHVNIEHKDILSPAKGTSLDRNGQLDDSVETPSCPMCYSTSFANSEELALHIEEHFSKKSTTPSPMTSPVSDCTSSDRLLAKDMERREKEVRRLQEQREFEMLQAQYGMDNQGNFREQSVTNMQRAVYAGEMSVADYWEKQCELKAAESSGIDVGSSCTRGLVPKVKAVSAACSNVESTHMCSAVDHYATSYGDKGWGCGYRNAQMLLSSLLQHTSYNELVYKIWSCSSSGGVSDGLSRSSMPSISRLQKTIEWAWAQGIDIQGAEQLGGKLVNTRKWIGATEVITLLLSLGIRCHLVDFHKPTSANGSHPEMFQWVLQYFLRKDDFKLPLYLQHQGHSRTIIGVERMLDGSVMLLVLDPSHNSAQMKQFHNVSGASGAMRLVRKSMAAMKAKQYQIVSVEGTFDSELQYQQSKILQSSRIPQDR